MLLVVFRLTKANNTMRNINTPFHLMPSRLETGQTLTVSAEEHFHQLRYEIFDFSGKLIRRGNLSNKQSEFKICLVGISPGTYSLKIGEDIQYFTIE